MSRKIGRKVSAEARKFVSQKIRKNIREGKPTQQAVAVAFSQARKAGFKVPKAPSGNPHGLMPIQRKKRMLEML